MENYSIISNFGGVTPNITQLNSEIKSNVGISTILYGTSMYQDNVSIEFQSNISPAEKIVLNGIVSSHVPVFVPKTPYQIDFLVPGTNVKSSSYTRVGTKFLPKTDYATAEAICYMDSSLSSYVVQITDRLNKQILLNTVLTNTTESFQNLGVLTNLPTSSTEIEVSIKKNGGNAASKVYFENLTIHYS